MNARPLALGCFVGLMLGVALGVGLGDRIWTAMPYRFTTETEQDFTALDRAATRVEGGLEVGVSVGDFAGNLRSLATEVALAERAASSDQDRVVLKGYTAALDVYQDSLDLWTLSIDQDTNFIPTTTAMGQKLVEKYNIKREQAALFGTEPDRDSLYVDGVRQYLWALGGLTLATAREVQRLKQDSP